MRWTNLDSDNLLPLENYGELNRDENVIFCSGTMYILFSEILKRGLQSAGIIGSFSVAIMTWLTAS
jgi:hypothetical protein